MSQDELRGSDALFRTLVEASPVAIFIIAEDRRFTYVNPAMAAATGYSPQELLGTDFLRLLLPLDREAAEGRLEACARMGPGRERHEMRIRTAGGQEHWLDLSLTPIVCDGQPGLLGTGIDVTERKRLEEAVNRRQQFEALGRLAGGVAHDFNNLMLVISGQAERLLDGLERADPLRASAEAIARAAERSAVLTEHLLAFGRRQTLIARPVDLREVIAALEPGLRAGTDDRIRAIVRVPGDLPLVRADRRRLERVLTSLYENAREAMPEGGEVVLTADIVTVDARMREGRPWLPPGGRWVRLRLGDSGPGIPATVLPRVFEPFFTTKPGGAGSGLGLSTVYGIIKQSAGYVWVDSTPGTGACVTILLPPVAAGPQVVAPAGVPATKAAPRVLLVEDQDGVRDLLTTVLQRNGFDVVSAATAEAALDLASTSSFDLLLTDVVLPGMAGPDLARQIRLQAPGTHVLFMSGYTGDAVLDTAEFGGETAFIQKPFASNVLIARLRSVLSPDEEGTGRSSSSTSR